jgi:hypothetical protein
MALRQLNRLRQVTRETLTTAKDQKTEIPSDIDNLFAKADGVTHLFDKSIEKVEVRPPLDSLDTHLFPLL